MLMLQIDDFRKLDRQLWAGLRKVGGDEVGRRVWILRGGLT